MRQLPFPQPRVQGPLIVAYGGGVNTMAMSCVLYDQGIVPTAIVMSDPGHEKPEGFAEALAMEANAEIDSPDVVGLMRCMPHGRRQLRVWNGERPTFEREPETIACGECGT